MRIEADRGFENSLYYFELPFNLRQPFCKFTLMVWALA
jgi:hypothetical protein